MDVSVTFINITSEQLDTIILSVLNLKSTLPGVGFTISSFEDDDSEDTQDLPTD